MDALVDDYLRLMFGMFSDLPGNYLHFGLWDDLPKHPSHLAESQAAYTRLIVEGLRLEPGTTVLDVGPGEGGVARELVAAGAVVTAVCPDPKHAKATLRNTGEKATVLETPFEKLGDDVGTFDRVLFAESFGFPVYGLEEEGGVTTALDLCADRLAPDGELLICDFMPEPTYDGILDHPRLKVVEDRDLTESIAYTVTALQHRFTRIVRPYHDLMLSALRAYEPELADRARIAMLQVPNGTVRAVLAGSIEHAERLEVRPYHYLRLVHR